MQVLASLQRVGKALLTPIAVLPAAALLLRLGADDVFNIPVMMAAGGAIFDNLPLLFAVGVAIGLTEGAGAAALAAVVGQFVLIAVLTKINKDINMGVFSGLIVGAISALLYQRYKDTKLPDYLQFFGGRRFVPIITSFACLIAGIAFGYIWPPIQNGIEAGGRWIVNAGALGVFTYGTVNRLLIPTGLHHVLNTLVWFTFGDFTSEAGKLVHGDLHRYFAGDKTAGIFMAGFYPIMMFGLPAACLAMIKEAKSAQKRLVTGILLSAGLTSFLTGITEPVEFSFMFLAPLLYLVHALLSGASLALSYFLGIRHGFGFSAGAIDYFLNFGLSTKAELLIPIGLVYGVIYYFLFSIIIRRFNLATPGREPEELIRAEPTKVEKKVEMPPTDLGQRTRAIVDALGGKENIKSQDACITRLRLTVVDEGKVNEEELKKAGVFGVVRLGGGIMQVVVGPQAELISEEMKKT
ncbi:MAG: PTS sugar transporter [Armatimonadetes bacterium CG07_land_8_20_14_0_80_40_9]|nr:MAG: PTS sugar transporter [Armatimonadetes bacterium CG07_land_8_20_14_0_80_40_9]